MARQVLENGVILPAEYSDDWYDDMTSNLTKLDDVIGSDSEKLSSTDVGAAALSNNYNDLDNLPTIPTVNDAVLTIQKNGVDVQTFTANASSNVTCNITVPTKTSDLTNDSNFVDTSNSAVASGITSAKVTSYDTHIADTDIHVTTADKNKWNNQTYVFRYSSTALTASSTNSNTLLDNTDNLKVGDKVIDSSGVLFSITAIDTENSTFTIGTALIDLAQDSDVVHKSDAENITGKKTFLGVSVNFKSSVGVYGNTSGNASMNFYDKNGMITSYLRQGLYSNGLPYIKIGLYGIDANNQTVENNLSYAWFSNVNQAYFRPETDNFVYLGTENFKWKSVYATNYYYGSNNVEFSTKFVTTDTAQTISGNKTFSSNVNVYNSDNTATTPNLYLRSSKIEISSQGNTSGDQNLTYLDKNNATYAYVKGAIQSNGSAVKIRAIAKDSSDNSVVNELQMLAYTNGNKAIFPSYSNEVDLGISSYKWKSFNGVEPSSLSLPSDRSARIDISSYITNLGNGDDNIYTVPANGYIYLYFTSINGVICFSQTSGGLTNYAQTFVRYQGDGQLYAFFPVRKSDNFVAKIYTSSTAVVQSAYFIPCQGNV